MTAPGLRRARPAGRAGRRPGVALGCACLLALACGPRPDRPRTGDGPPEPARAAPACPADTSVRHEDPVALVEEFVRRDAEGPFEREDLAAAWEAAALRCPDRTPSDAYEVITAYRVEPLDSFPDSVRVLVRRTRAYVVARDGPGRPARLRAFPARWVDTVLVVRTPFRWRIARRHAGAHRLPARALDELRTLSAADSAVLETLVAAPGG